MRNVLIVTVLLVMAGGAIATIRVPDKRAEQLVANARANPAAAVKAVETAVLHCVPGLSESKIGKRFAGYFIAPLYLRTISLRLSGMDEKERDIQTKAWIVKYRPEVLKLPDGDFSELSGYMKAIGDRDVKECVFDNAVGTA